MAFIKNFESDAHRHQRMITSPTSNYDPLDNPTVKGRTKEQESFFDQHIKQYSDFISWARWFPDLFLDMITPKTSNIRLDFDQRVFLRSICRFISVYGVFPRGWGKCVSGDTYLYTTRGIIQIKDLFNCEENGVEDYTTSLSIKTINRDGNAVDVERGVYNGYKDTKKIKTKMRI